MAIKSRKNYYSILGVTPDSDSSEVKYSYRHLARIYHPDVNKEPESAEKFKDILEAYETLSDEIKRKQYDMLNGFYKTPKTDFSQKKNNENSATNSSGTKNKKQYKEEQSTSNNQDKHDEKNNTKSSSNIENNGNTNDFENKKSYYSKKQNYTNDGFQKKYFRDCVSSILDEITKNHKESKSTRSPKDGDDISTVISVTMTEAINGTERILNVMHKELCPHCEGRRFINGSKCPKCGGSGVFELNRKITVKIPARVKNGAKLRLVGEGNPGFFGGKNGNLYITLHVEDDENIRIEGDNILYKLSISPFEAVLGGQIEIPTSSEKICLTIPAMTKSGQQFRISKKGLKTNGKFGDMIVTVEIQIPENLSTEEKVLYGKLKKLSRNNIRA